LVGIAVSCYLLQRRKEKYKALIVALCFFLLWLIYPSFLAQFIACSVQIVTSFKQKSVVILLVLAEAASYKIVLWSFWVVGENWY